MAQKGKNTAKEPNSSININYISTDAGVESLFNVHFQLTNLGIVLWQIIFLKVSYSLYVYCLAFLCLQEKLNSELRKFTRPVLHQMKI
ncbi:hypothetical protein ALGA_2357 [Labilibaculum antarcticum]|uniref:Uncharacterized protein n=1 Tax=Labilibaculum antarcticum TaxID=1717717 RepID=A0A1Y1CK33_9BACT|nr:hypothetical protein ALGA_2357 [Labilibaculum antarcticum]